MKTSAAHTAIYTNYIYVLLSICWCHDSSFMHAKHTLLHNFVDLIRSHDNNEMWTKEKIVIAALSQNHSVKVF